MGGGGWQALLSLSSPSKKFHLTAKTKYNFCLDKENYRIST